MTDWSSNSTSTIRIKFYASTASGTDGCFYITPSTYADNSILTNPYATRQETALMSPDPKVPAKREAPVDVLRTGDKIIIPEGMALDDAMKWIRRKQEDEEREVAVRHVFVCSPLDGAVAFHASLAKIYGWTSLVPTPGWWPEPPLMISVPISVDEHLQVPWGAVKIPNVSGTLQTGMETVPTQKFIIMGTVKQKDAPTILRIAEGVKEHLATKSIYKGKPVTISYDWQRAHPPVKFNLVDHSPQFMDVRNVDESSLVFSPTIDRDIRLGLFAPIERTEALRQNHVPLKRGVLFEGPYGVGKTLTAAVTAKKCQLNGWTFVYLKNVLDLQKGVEFARMYPPAVVFAEDIDRAVHGDRTEEMDAILNTLDGVDSKTHEIITVVTSNDVRRINQALIRPGRLDTVVSVRPPDATAAARLVRQYGRDMFSRNTNFEAIGLALNGQIPAVIREVVERAKIAAIDRVGPQINGEVTEQDIIATAESMKAHIDLLNSKPDSRKKSNAVTVYPDRSVEGDLRLMLVTDTDGRDEQ